MLAKMPEEKQKKLMVKIISSGKIFSTPVWKMLFQTLSFYGGDEKKLKETLVQKHDGLESVLNKMINLGEETKSRADQMSNDINIDSEIIRDMYLEASMYYFMAYFFVSDELSLKEIYSEANPVFEEFMKRMNPPVEKWEFKYKTGNFYAHVYYPKGEGAFPVILYYPGNEGIKEHAATYAKYAIARNLALISIEPPGFGESGLSGSKLSNIEDYGISTDLIYKKIVSNQKLDKSRLATFGVSGGSLISIIVAGFHDYITATAGIGAPDYEKMWKVWKNAMAEQRRKTYTYTGLDNAEDVINFLKKYGSDTEKVLGNVKCPVLLIHGEKDYISKAKRGKDITDRIGEKAIHRIIPGDDHLCSNSIGNGLADEIFDWLASQLKTKNTVNKRVKKK